MDEQVTRNSIAQLNRQWENMLEDSDRAVTDHYSEYRRLKKLSRKIISQPVDIADYISTRDRLVELLTALDPFEKGTIFLHFRNRLSPGDIWLTRMLRVECTDLLAHLKVLDQWRMAKRSMRIIK